MLSFKDFTSKVQGGESRLNPGKACDYILITDDDGDEVYYGEWYGDVEDDRIVTDEQLKEAYLELIAAAIAAGKYEVKQEQDCGCSIDWTIVDGQLIKSIDSDECWKGAILYVDSTPIAQHIETESIVSLIESVSIEWIIDTFASIDIDIEEIMDDSNKQGYNHIHLERYADSLTRFIDDNKYKTFIKYPRNFSNEYTCILSNDTLVYANIISTKEWVDRYLEQDTQLTEYFISFKFID